MARTLYTRNSYTGGAPQARLLADITSTDTSITLTGTNAYWNTLGKSGADDAGFYLCLSVGSANEEKVFVPGGAYSWVGTSITLTNVVRGVDGTPASAHSGSDPVSPVMTATDLNEANYAVSQTVGQITAQGQLLYGDGANELAVLAAGAVGQFLTANGSGAAPSWSTLSGVADLFIASNTTGNTQATVSVSGFTKYVVVAWRTITGPATSYGANIDFGAATNQNGVTVSINTAGQSATLVTFYPVEGVATTATTVNLNSTGGTPTSATNRLFVIGLHA